MYDFKDRDGLYYPYVHIRDLEWLRRTLLIFPHVHRIVPAALIPNDQPEIWDFRETQGRRGPLLQFASLDSQGVQPALDHLCARIDRDLKDDPSFIGRFNRAATLAEKRNDTKSFQMHPDKIRSDSLFSLLESRNLAWDPKDPHHPSYRELHPRLGEAIMSTLAIACARDQGLSIVTTEESAELNACMATEGVDEIYEIWTREQTPKAARKKPLEAQMLEILVYQRIENVHELTAQNLGALSSEREPIEALQSELQNIASKVPEDDLRDPTALKARLEAEVDSVLKRWARDRANLSNFAKKFFGVEGVRETGKALTEVAKKAVWPTGGVAAGGSLVGGLGTFDLLGAGVGFAIGVTIHAAASWQKTREDAAKSPFRYLSMAEKSGVVFSVAR